jgi:hypothetical protein
MTLLRFTATAMVACLLAISCKKHETLPATPAPSSAPPAHFDEIAGTHTFHHQYKGIYWPTNPYPVYMLADTSMNIIALGDTALFFYNDILVYTSSTDSTLQFVTDNDPLQLYSAYFSYNFLTHYVAYKNSRHISAAAGNEYNYLWTP